MSANVFAKHLNWNCAQISACMGTIKTSAGPPLSLQIITGELKIAKIERELVKDKLTGYSGDVIKNKMLSLVSTVT